ncbi:hypothetical protein ACXVUM_01865 [Williamsia sp. SKLECPSW1]
MSTIVVWGTSGSMGDSPVTTVVPSVAVLSSVTALMLSVLM